MSGSANTPPEDRKTPLRMLTVFADGHARRAAREALAACAPEAACQDASSVTEAVLALLGSRFDVVLVDVGWAGDLLQALQRHVQRSAPLARLIGFAAQPEAAAPPGLREVHAWSQLPDVVAGLQGAHARGAALSPPD